MLCITPGMGIVVYVWIIIFALICLYGSLLPVVLIGIASKCDLMCCSKLYVLSLMSGLTCGRLDLAAANDGLVTSNCSRKSSRTCR